MFNCILPALIHIPLISSSEFKAHQERLVSACNALKAFSAQRWQLATSASKLLQVMAFSACVGFTFDNFELINSAGAERSASIHNRCRRQSSSLARSCNAN